MSEQQSIRDEIADEIAGVVTGEGFYSMTIGINAAQEAAGLILASPVIRRIQAEALRDAAWKFAEGDWANAFAGGDVVDDISAVQATEAWFKSVADRIERGE